MITPASRETFSPPPRVLARRARLTALVFGTITALLAGAAIIHRDNPWTGRFTAHYDRGVAVNWTATLETPEGTFRFAIIPDLQGKVAVDGQVVADALHSTPVHLSAGLHQVYVEHHPESEPPQFELTWSRNGGSFQPLPRDAVYPRKPGAAVLALTHAARASLTVLQWVWAATFVGCVLLIAFGTASELKPWLARQIDWRTLKWIVLASLVMNATPVWWGLPALWAPDELMPTTVLTGLSAHFANGWFDRWPPFHYYTLAAAWTPLLALGTWGRIAFDGSFWPAMLTLISRTISLVYAAGIVTSVAIVGTQAFGRRAGLLAAGAFALVVPFLYYAKTANLDVPYVFWFALSLVMYQRLLGALAMRDVVLFALFAMLAICTKDQAYALYPLMAAAIVARTWREYQRAGRPVWRLVFDSRLVAGAVTGLIVFALGHNLLFNWDGFVSHVRYITGPGNEDYRVFAPTLTGRLALLGLTVRLIEMSWGWPLTIMAAAGVAIALAARQLRHTSIVLLAPAVAYYFAFINVVLYNYDRFVLPICLVLSFFAGLALDRLLGARRGWRTALVAGILAYTFLYSTTIDALMLRDSRYMVERWVRTDVAPGQLLAVSGPRELQPKLDRPWADISTLTDLAEKRPSYYLLSADYARGVSLETGWGQLIAALEGGQAGYTLLARVRCPSPWSWLPGAHPELTGPRAVDPSTGVVSILRDVNPTIEVFGRTPVSPVHIGCSADPSAHP